MARNDHCPCRKAHALYLFNESYRDKPFLADLDAANLEVVWSNPLNIRKRIDENGRERVNVHDWMKTEYEWLKLTPEEIKAQMQETQDFLHSHLNHIKTKK